VVTGFEPVDLLQGIHMAIGALEDGRHGVLNQYSRSVHREGNAPARRILEDVFEVCDRQWRGMGAIPGSGWRLRDAYAAHDAASRFAVEDVRADESPECIAGLILKGRKKPQECPAFGTRCTPENPLGAPMVSTEGACSAYHQYAREETR
jgi:hydrogenase expression/formation protein HypD